MAWVAVVAAVIQTVSEISQNLQNANRANKEGKIAMDQANQSYQAVERQSDDLFSTQLQQSGASGFAVTGSPVDVMLESAREMRLKALDELYIGKINKYKSKMQAEGYKSAAMWAGIAGIPKAVSAYYTAGGSSIAGSTGSGSGSFGGFQGNYNLGAGMFGQSYNRISGGGSVGGGSYGP
jgi:hypothetical protein